jgi:hypothetical protein
MTPLDTVTVCAFLVAFCYFIYWLGGIGDD